MSSFELVSLVFLAPVFFIVAAFLLAKNSKKIPLTYNFFANDQAVVPLKGAYTFAKADSPIGFIVCTVLSFGFGLAALGYGLRAVYRSLSNQHLHVETDLYP